MLSGILSTFAQQPDAKDNLVRLSKITVDPLQLDAYNALLKEGEAYKSHIQTPHFQKYKQGTLSMVQKLELVDSTPLIPGLKIK